MSMNKVLLGSLVAAAFAASAPFAVAETADVSTDPALVVAQASPQRTPDSTRPQHRGPEKRAFQMPSERVEARLAYAKTALKITDAQQPQWEGFANVLRKHARDMDQRFQQRRTQWEAARAARGDAARSATPDARMAQRPNVTAIDRLERTQQRMAERSARLNEVIAAAKPLYAALSPEQRQIADGMLARKGHGHGGQHQQHRGMHRGA
jgi:hypothetical protein